MSAVSETTDRRPESVLVVVHTAEAKTLLLKRIPPWSFWQSVTGSMKWSGESKVQTAVRELREETGIEAKPADLRDWNRTFKFTIPGVYKGRYRDGVRVNREHVFSIMLASVQPVVLQPDEHSEYRWVDIHSAMDIVWSWSNREALQMVADAG